MSEFSATQMTREVFDQLTKPRNVNAKHFQYMTIAYWMIQTMKQTIEFTPEQLGSMENAIGLHATPSEVNAIYSEFTNVQKDVSKEVSKQLTLAIHAESKKKRTSKKVANPDTEKPKRKYTKKVATEIAAESSDGEPVVIEKPKRKYTKKVATEIASEPSDGEPVAVEKPKRKYTKKVATEIASEPSDGEPVAVEKPKRKYTKKVAPEVAAEVEIEVATEVAAEVEIEIAPEVEAEIAAVWAEEHPIAVAEAPKPKKRVSNKQTIPGSDVAEPEVPKKRGPKKKVNAPNNATETMIQTIHSFEEILNNMGSDDDVCDDELRNEPYR